MMPIQNKINSIRRHLAIDRFQDYDQLISKEVSKKVKKAFSKEGLDGINDALCSYDMGVKRNE